MESKYWYEDPQILLDNPKQIIPSKSLSRVERINAIARLACYILLFVLVCNKYNKWMVIPIIMLAITYLLGNKETFADVKKDDKEECTKPTKDNPFMNFTLGDAYNKPDRTEACAYETAKSEMRKEFRKHVHFDLSDIWGKHSSDRQFYIMPNTRIINDTKSFAEWLYGNNGVCKSEGVDCLKVRDPQYHRGRITKLDD